MVDGTNRETLLMNVGGTVGAVNVDFLETIDDVGEFNSQLPVVSDKGVYFSKRNEYSREFELFRIGEGSFPLWAPVATIAISSRSSFQLNDKCNAGMFGVELIYPEAFFGGGKATSKIHLLAENGESLAATTVNDPVVRHDVSGDVIYLGMNTEPKPKYKNLGSSTCAEISVTPGYLHPMLNISYIGEEFNGNLQSIKALDSGVAIGTSYGGVAVFEKKKGEWSKTFHKKSNDFSKHTNNIMSIAPNGKTFLYGNPKGEICEVNPQTNEMWGLVRFDDLKGGVRQLEVIGDTIYAADSNTIFSFEYDTPKTTQILYKDNSLLGIRKLPLAPLEEVFGW